MNKIIFEKVGTRLKQARELRHITLEEAGKKVDVHKSTVLRWENGETEKIKLPIIEMLSSYYNVNPIWLMGYDVPMEETITKESENPIVSIPLLKIIFCQLPDKPSAVVQLQRQAGYFIIQKSEQYAGDYNSPAGNRFF